MTYKKYPDEITVNNYILKKEPLILAVPFDENEPVLMSLLDDSFEHHILLQHFGVNPTYTDKYYRIVADTESAEWTFVCPTDYRGIKDRQKRIIRYYNNGFAAISEVLSDIDYFSDTRIPKRYCRHFEEMGDESTYMP